MAEQIPVAVIPVAGMGARLAPVTRVLPKAMFPLVGADGTVRPVADWIAREALQAGCRRICLVTSPGQDGLLRAYFASEEDLAGRVEFVTGIEPFGFGYAVWAARTVAAGGPLMVLLGDHVRLPDRGAPAPAGQVAEAFLSRRPAAMVGVQRVGPEELARVGVCRGEMLRENLYRCAELVEKPGAAEASRLATPGLPEGGYLAHAGIYVFTEEIFECLGPLVSRRAEGAEVGLTEAQQLLLRRHPEDYLLWRIRGSTFDVGTPEGYLRTLGALAGKSTGGD